MVFSLGPLHPTPQSSSGGSRFEWKMNLFCQGYLDIWPGTNLSEAVFISALLYLISCSPFRKEKNLFNFLTGLQLFSKYTILLKMKSWLFDYDVHGWFFVFFFSFPALFRCDNKPVLDYGPSHIPLFFGFFLVFFILLHRICSLMLICLLDYYLLVSNVAFMRAETILELFVYLVPDTWASLNNQSNEVSITSLSTSTQSIIT